MTPFTRSLVTCRNNYFPAKIAQSAEKCMDERERKKKEGKKQAWQEEEKEENWDKIWASSERERITSSYSWKNEPRQYVIPSDVVCITPPSRISSSRVTVVRRRVAMEWEDFLESEHHYVSDWREESGEWWGVGVEYLEGGRGKTGREGGRSQGMRTVKGGRMGGKEAIK